MSDGGPEVHQLSKEDDEDSTRSAVSEEVEDDYPEDLESETPDTGEETDYGVSTDTGVMDVEEKSEEEKTLKEKLSIHHKASTEKEFTQLGKSDTVLFDTPIEGMKTGDIVDRQESWSGVLECTVDSGAREYTLTPFEDDFSAKYVATVDSTLDLSEKVLDTLEAASLDDTSAGDNVVLDVPKMGATRATATDIVESKNQGIRGTFKAADGLHFVVYEEPSPTQTKEQPYIVGRER